MAKVEDLEVGMKVKYNHNKSVHFDKNQILTIDNIKEGLIDYRIYFKENNFGHYTFSENLDILKDSKVRRLE